MVRWVLVFCFFQALKSWILLALGKLSARGPGSLAVPEPRLTVSQTGDVVRGADGLQVKPDYSFAECQVLDYLLVPGGPGTRREVDNAALVAFVQKQAAGCRHVLSVCTGAFVLEAAGLLQGRKATTHWHSLGRLRSHSGVTVDEQRFVRDGNVWTAAGESRPG